MKLVNDFLTGNYRKYFFKLGVASTAICSFCVEESVNHRNTFLEPMDHECIPIKNSRSQDKRLSGDIMRISYKA